MNPANSSYRNPSIELAGLRVDEPVTMFLDANLRFMKAQLLSNMRYPRKVQESIDDIENRFEGRESMLVEYPVGEQRALGEALEMLRDQKWNS